MNQRTGGRPIAALFRATCLLVLGWSFEPVAVPAAELPELPSNSLDVLATVDGRQIHGHIGERRSTYDGRVQITRNKNGTWFYTARAELFTRHVVDERRSNEGQRLRVEPGLFHASTSAEASADHVALCDPYLAAGTRKNPYACRHNGRGADCYDVSVLQVVQVPRATPSGRGSELWSTPVTITVRNPKARNGTVARVERRGAPVRSPIQGTPARSGDLVFEPVMSGDGRLLILNAGDTLLYSVMDAGATPCDARNWKRLAHLPRMHRDPKMQRYGIARYAIRSSENRKVKQGARIRGAYPWIDRQAKILFFTQVGAQGLFYRDAENKMRSRFEVLNPPRRNRTIELGGATRFAMSFFGLWSQGKIVVPDNRVNNIDFLTGQHGYQAEAVLYRSDPGGVPLQRAPIVDLNSPENQWNYHSAFAPRSPRDVVWWLSANTGMTDEVVFDEVLDVGSLIFSPMNAAVNNKTRSYRDGFDTKRLRGYVNTPRIQNAAASQLLWRLPSYGKLIGGRIEPIAAGGVTGKGLWLDGDLSRLEYSIPGQGSGGAMATASWTTTIWLDPRDVSRRRRLLTFPDGSWVDVVSDRIYVGGPDSEAILEVPSALALREGQWSHLALVSNGDRVDLYLQGFKLGSLQGSYLRLRSGLLGVGKPAAVDLTGFHGWVDELRVVSGIQSQERLCNYAHGTLRGLSEQDQGAEFTTAGSYPPASHEEISVLLESTQSPTFERYRCERERDRSHPCLEAIHRLGGAEASCVRGPLLFPEGPLYHDLPRPDSRANSFCRSCHVQGHPTPSLRTTGPLKAGAEGSELSDDPRRQPSQAPVRLHGFIPKAFLGMPRDVDAPPEGVLLDPWLYPGARGSGSPE